jgi:hypothetical protein
MKQRQLLFGKFLLAVAFIGVQCIPFAEAKAQNLDSSLLWKVEGNDIKTAYIFGTIHLMPQAQFELKEKVVDALGKVEILALEMDMSDPGLQGKMMQNASMKDGTTLDQLLDKGTYDRLDTMLQESIGASVAFMNGFKPFIVSSFLIGRLIDGQPASFEAVLVQEAKKREMPIKGLETVEAQMAIFDRISYKDQAEDLADMVNDESKVKKMYAEMIDLYLAENLNGLYEFISREMSEVEQKELLDMRNRKWVPLFEAWSADKTVFYGVGAGHLPGKVGLVALLKEAGYTVTPVK